MRSTEMVIAQTCEKPMLARKSNGRTSRKARRIERCSALFTTGTAVLELQQRLETTRKLARKDDTL